MSYNCLLLDLDDTLLSFNESEKISLIKVLEKYNIPTTQENIQIYRDINNKLWSDFEIGKIKKQELEKVRFKSFCKSANIKLSNACCDEMSKDYRNFLSNSAILFDGVIEFLEDVEIFTTIAIVTNGIEDVQKNRLKISGLENFIDALYTSEKLGCHKPNKQIFLSAMKDLGIENKRKVLVVGDRLNTDIKGGINAGLDTCWINFEGKENNTNISPTYEVRDFTQLKNIILEAREL